MQKQQRHGQAPIRFSTSNGPEGGGGGGYGVKVFGAPQGQPQQQAQSAQPPQPLQEKPPIQLHHPTHQVHYNHPHARPGSVSGPIPHFFSTNPIIPTRARAPYGQSSQVIRVVNYESGQTQLPYAASVYPSLLNHSVMYGLGGGGEGGVRGAAGGPPQGFWQPPPPPSILVQQQMPPQSISTAAAAINHHPPNSFPYYTHSVRPINYPSSATPPSLQQQSQPLQQQQPPVMVSNAQGGGGAAMGSMVGGGVNVMAPGQREHHQPPQGNKQRKNRLPIIDPSTGSEVVVEVDSTPPATSHQAHQEHHPTPSTGTGQTAAEFAQKVAAVAAEEWPREVSTEDDFHRGPTPVVSAQAPSAVYELRKARTPSPPKRKARTPSPPQEPPREQTIPPVLHREHPREPLILREPEPPKELPAPQRDPVRQLPQQPPQMARETPTREQPRDIPPREVIPTPQAPRESREPTPVMQQPPPVKEIPREAVIPKETREVAREPPKDPARESREPSREPKEPVKELEKEVTPEPVMETVLAELAPPVVVQQELTPPASAQAEEKPPTTAVPVAAPEPQPDPATTVTPDPPTPPAPTVAPAAAVVPPAAAAPGAPPKKPNSNSFAEMFDISSMKQQAIDALAAAAAAQVEEPPAAAPQSQQQSGKAQQKPKQRKAKHRDINMKDKEGSDMDAFTDGPARREASPAPAAAAPPASTVTTTPATTATATASPDDEEEETSDASDALVAAMNRENARPASPSASADVIETRVISRTEPEKPVLKYEYKEDQWSPLNPQGKKVYDRDFLMKLRSDPLSSKKPDNMLHDLEIFVRDRESGRGDRQGDRGGDSGIRRMNYPSGYSSMQRNNGFVPDFFKNSSHSQGSSRAPSSNKRLVQPRSSSSRDGGRGPKSYNSLSLRDDIRLNQSENAWKPVKMNRDRNKESREDSETDNLYRNVRGILNKLTPQKFETLLNQFKALPISTPERLRGVIGLVFEKAIDEPAFSSSYAELCRFLGKIEVSASTGAAPKPVEVEGTGVPKPVVESFRKLLITRCQTEFENNKKAEMDFEKKQLEIDECPDLDKRKELQLLFNEEERKIRMKSVGLVRFIGELYKLKMLTANIMHGCIRQLLGKYDEESLECLCKLLTTIGKELESFVKQSKDSQAQEQEWSEYFARMELLSKKDNQYKVSSRVRFMLQDVIELRENKWVPRRDENKPKTMAQIQEEVEKESEKAAQLAAQPLRRHDDSRRRREGMPRGNNQNDDGWNVVGKSVYRANYSPEATKIQAMRSTASSDMQNRGDVHLGSAKNYSRWGSGAVAKSSSGAPILNDPKFVTNAFAALNADGDDRKPPASLASRGGKPSQSAERERAIQGLKTFVESSNKIQAAGPTSKRLDKRDAPPTPVPEPAAAVEEETQLEVMDEGKLSLWVEGLVKEYHNCFKKKVDHDNTFMTLKVMLEKTEAEEIIVMELVNKNMEMKNKEGRIKTYALIGNAITSNLVKLDTFIKVMTEILSLADDLIIDLPNFWSYVGEIFVPLIVQGVLDFSHLKTVAAPNGQQAELASTLKEIFSYSILEKGPAWVKEIWGKSGVKVADFLPEKEAQKFLEDYAFVEGAKVAVRDSNLPFDVIEEKLLALLKSNQEEKFDHIFEWISMNVGKRTSDPQFIDVLIKSVIMASTIESTNFREDVKLDKVKFSNHLILIKRYVDNNNEELELRCLYTVKNVLVNTLEAPSGIILEIFTQLCDSSAISVEAFVKWSQRDRVESPWEKDGKGVALTILSPFFAALQRDDLMEDDPS